MAVSIRVQEADFDPGAELAAVTEGRTDVGGTCLFVGQVREFGDGETLTAMELEHYPGMTEKELERIAGEAADRFAVSDITLIHRVGRLVPADRIVLVIAAGPHRADAFDACRFLIDWLKTRAPFWKREHGPDGSHWVAAKDSDAAAAGRWRE